ncbi:TOM1-like protein 5 [Linum perenne]
MMASDLVDSATSEKLIEVDWAKNIEICELVARDQMQAKDVVKAIKKRFGSKSPNVQLHAVMLLEMLMNNIGDPVHQQVIETAILPILVKIVKKKSELPVRERIFLLLDATQTSLGGASGKFPQYYSAYYDLVSAGVKFPERPREVPSSHPTSQLTNRVNQPTPRMDNGPTRPTVRSDHRTTLTEELATSRQQPEPQAAPESSILQKAGNALEVLKEVLDAVDSQNPEAAKDEFTLDLVEQCSFQKQRVMHLVMTCRDEKVVSRAIALNEELQNVLTRHDDLLADITTSTANHGVDEEGEEEEIEQLSRRLRKGKACARPEDEMKSKEQQHLGLFATSLPPPSEMLNRPLIRAVESGQSPEGGRDPPVAVSIPPPPAKHMEREKFFKENKVDGSSVSGHMRGLSLHSRNGSSSRSGSIDFAE